jgi:hypothetical protein
MNHEAEDSPQQNLGVNPEATDSTQQNPSMHLVNTQNHPVKR